VSGSQPTEAEHLSVMGMAFQELDICFDFSKNETNSIDVLISNGRDPLYPGATE